jgi:hypothetical protein
MTVQTQAETTLPAWEANFFAGIMLEAAETKATEAKRKHETAATSYIASLEGQDRTKVIVARTNLAHSLKRLHFVQKNLNKAKAEANLTSIVTIAQ